MKLSLLSLSFFVTFLPQIWVYSSILHPEIQANVVYPDRVNTTIREVYLIAIKRSAKETFVDLKMPKSPFSAAFEDLSLIMDLDQTIFIPRLFEDLKTHYLKIASTFNKHHKHIVEDSLEYEIRTTYVKEVLIYLIECQRYSITHETTEHLTFLKFIYRFSNSECYGFRFLNSIQYIYHSIVFTDCEKFFDLIIKYFDHSRPTLTVVYLKLIHEDLLPLKEPFIKFLTELYEKVMHIDQIRFSESFNRHACMCISSIISCSFYDEMSDKIRILLPKVDMKKLIVTLNFAESSVEIIKGKKGSDLWYVELLASHLFNDILISNLDPSNCISYGSVVSQIYYDYRSMYDESFENLSIQSKIILDQIFDNYIDYFNSTLEFEIINSLKVNFLSCESDDLINISERMNRIINVMPKFSKQNNQGCVTLLSLVLDLISELVSQFTRNFNPENTKLNFERLSILIKLSTISLSGHIYLEKTAESVVKTLLLFNILCQRGTSFSADQLFIVKESISSILDKLIENGIFIKGIQNHKIVYKFFENISPSTGNDSVCMLLSSTLEKSSNKIFTLTQTMEIINSLEIDLNLRLLNVSFKILIEFAEFTAVSNNISNFKKGIVFYFYLLLLKKNLLSKTQKLILANFLEKYFKQN